MQEIVVISGKGGTGKTSLVASLAVLYSNQLVVADCDVDAADLHLVLEPQVMRDLEFSGGSEARIDRQLCTHCGECMTLCRFEAIAAGGASDSGAEGGFKVDSLACEGCGVCARFCPQDAIRLFPTVDGHWFISRARSGPMVHARMAPGAENSGRLVTLLRQQAESIAREHQVDLVLCDGSPGIGCPVIASLTGADLALIVVEPTLSGLHDFRRVAHLTGQLKVPGLLVVNKVDVNPQVAGTLVQESRMLGIELLGAIPYDPDVTRAQKARRAVVEVSSGPAAQAIRRIWNELQRHRETLADRPGVVVQLASEPESLA